MEIFILFVLFALLFEFTIRGLFNTKWREESQTRVDGIKQEKTFWNLMYGTFGDIELSAKDIFKLYVISLKDELRVGDFPMEKNNDPYNFNIKIIKKGNSPFKNIEILNKVIIEKEKVITELLKKYEVVVDETEIHKKIEAFKEDSWAIGDEYDKLANFLTRVLRGQKKGLEIWEAIKKLDKAVSNYEWDSKDRRVDFITQLKMAHVDIWDLIIKLLSEKITDRSESVNFEKNFKEWEQLEMIKWCVVDFTISAYPNGSNYLSRGLWRIITAIAQ